MTERVPAPGFLLLEDGTLFRGVLHGVLATTVAEVVFTTNMSGYQEVFTDPSYHGQIVVMTAPMIGNYGVNPADPESGSPQVAGVVVREMARTYSNWRAEGDLASYLAAAQIPVLEGIDTRRLTRHLRTVGVMRGVIAAGTEPTAEVLAVLDACPSMEGLDLASRVTTAEPYEWGNPQAPHHIVAYDFGIKRNILRLFDDAGCRVTVVPAQTSAEAVMEMAPDGVFPLQRSRRSRRDCLCARHGARARGARGADLRHLLGASALGPHVRRRNGEDALRASRRKSSRSRARERAHPDHLAEPRFRRCRARRNRFPGLPRSRSRT